MTRTSRRLKQKPTHTMASPSEERSRSRSSFRPAKLALTDPAPLSTAPCASLPSALPLQPLRRRGVSTIVGRGPTGLRPSTRCLLSGSSPQLLDATLRTIQVPVNQQSVGVGADLGRDPNCQSYQRGSQRL